MSGLTDEKIQLTKVQEKYEKWVGKFYLQHGRDIVELSGMLGQETWHSLHPHNQFHTLFNNTQLQHTYSIYLP